MKLFLITGTLGLILLASGSSLACDCITRPESECFKRADLVLEGELVRVNKKDKETVYTLRVRSLFKGQSGEEVDLVGGRTNCDYWFSPNIVYRVYARRFEDKLVTGQCSGTKVVRSLRRRRQGFR